MKPMSPMKPLAPMDMWWPAEFGEATTAGVQHGTRYVFFREARRLIVDRAGMQEVFDTGAHQITGVAQGQTHEESLSFTTSQGAVDLSDLKLI